MIKKLCKTCNHPITYSQTYCDTCMGKRTQHKKDNQRHYDSKRDIKLKKFYHSTEWELIRSVVKSRDHGLCLLCKAKGTLTYMDTVHHVIELKASWDDRLKLINLISLCHACHNKVHGAYDKSLTDKKEVQRLLKDLILGTDYKKSTLLSLS